MDKVNVTLSMFGMEAVPGKKKGKVDKWLISIVKVMYMSKNNLRESLQKPMMDIHFRTPGTICKVNLLCP